MYDLLHTLKEISYLLDTYEAKAKFCCDGMRCLNLYGELKTLHNTLYVTVNRMITECERKEIHGDK